MLVENIQAAGLWFAATLQLLLVLFAGDRYVVMDCGGGTVDLTVHQIRLPEGHLKELYKASGKKLLLEPVVTFIVV